MNLAKRRIVYRDVRALGGGWWTAVCVAAASDPGLALATWMFTTRGRTR